MLSGFNDESWLLGEIQLGTEVALICFARMFERVAQHALDFLREVIVEEDRLKFA